MPQGLADLVRAKYPGAYNDLSDDELERQVLAKYPNYKDLVQPKAPTLPPEQQRAAEWIQQHRNEPLTWEKVKQEAPHILSGALQLAASAAAAYGTGGMSLLPQPAGQVGAGVGGGAGVVSGVARTAIEGKDITGPDARKAALIDAAVNAAGPVIGKGLQTVAPAVMEGALRMSAPIRRKYGRMELGKLAVEERILPTQAGADKAKQLLIAERQAKLSDLAALPNQSVSLPPIAQAAEQNVAPKVM